MFQQIVNFFEVSPKCLSFSNFQVFSFKIQIYEKPPLMINKLFNALMNVIQIKTKVQSRPNYTGAQVMSKLKLHHT